MPLYASGRRNYDEVLAKNTSGGDDPAVVAKVIVAAATDRNPKLRRTAGTTARTINAVYRVAPGPHLRPRHPQIQPDAELIAHLRAAGQVATENAGGSGVSSANQDRDPGHARAAFVLA